MSISKTGKHDNCYLRGELKKQKESLSTETRVEHLTFSKRAHPRSFFAKEKTNGE